MNLFAPGMTALHRAGLGGLACTLTALEREHAAGRLRTSKLPAVVVNGVYPWDIAEDSITLRFGKPESAGDYLKNLFAFAFAITRSGLIYLPGQHNGQPSDSVLAALQGGITLTFLQHGRVRRLSKDKTTITYDFGGDGASSLVAEYRKCSGFKHQTGWEALVDTHGCLVSGAVPIDGPISPGTIIRHVAFTSDTGAEDPPARMLPLYFALVGCLALPVNRGVAALIVPEVADLKEFVYDRPAMTPTTAADCHVANAADAAFRAQVRLREYAPRATDVTWRTRQSMDGSAIPACDAITFMPTAWASQQKSRVATVHVPRGEDALLDRYQLAASHLPARIVKSAREASGRRKGKTNGEDRTFFLAESIIRPLVADNLARGLKWYAAFTNLMTQSNRAGKPYRNDLPFERKGLFNMIAEPRMWDEEGERLVVRAVHEAIRRRLAQIRSETDGGKGTALTQATKNRWDRFRERLRLALSGAKTERDVRFAFMDLFSRAGNVPALRDGWPSVLPVIRQDWHLARDLGLLALASYSSQSETDTPDQSDQTSTIED
jgi:CRISPR-associated protein Cas8a1/Csx13